MASGWPSRRGRSEFRPGSSRSTRKLAGSQVMATPSLRPEGFPSTRSYRLTARESPTTFPMAKAMGRVGATSENEVWVKSLVDGTEIEIPTEGFSSWIPLWSPDSKQLIYDRRDL